MDLERIPYGDAPNDRKGIDVRNLCIILDNNFVAVVEFLTGGLKQSGRLDQPIPVTSGGTGGNTALQARKNLGLVTGPNNELVFGNNSLELYDNRYTLYGRSNNDYAFTKLGVGKYRLQGLSASPYGSGYSMLFPKDELGNILVGAALLIENGVALITVHPVVINAGKYVLNTASFVDIPSNRFISLNIK